VARCACDSSGRIAGPALGSSAQALQVGDFVAHDGYELPSIRTDVIEQIDFFGLAG